MRLCKVIGDMTITLSESYNRGMGSRSARKRRECPYCGVRRSDVKDHGGQVNFRVLSRRMHVYSYRHRIFEVTICGMFGPASILASF